MSDTNINERFLIPAGSSLTNIKNTFNDFITQVQNSSFINILRNSRMRDHFTGVAAPYAWDVDLGITIDYTSIDTVVTFPYNTQISQTILQSIEDILEPIDQVLFPSTEYLAIFNITPTQNCEVGLTSTPYTAGLLNLLGSDIIGGEALYKTVYAGNTEIVYFVFKTAADFSGVHFYIKNTSSNPNSITLKKLSLVKGTLNLMDSIESNLFLDHIRYDNNILKWTYTDDGIIWLPFNEGPPPATWTASYTPVHDQIPILSAIDQDPGQPDGGILPIGNGYRSAIIDLTVGPIDLNTCKTSGVIYTGDGSVSISNAPYNNFDGNVWWMGDLDGDGSQFAINSQGNVWTRSCHLGFWSTWNFNSNGNTENLLINGTFSVWRRGGVASPFSLANGATAYTADRWRVSTAAHYTGNTTIAKDILHPESGVYVVPGSRNAFSMVHPVLSADVTLATRTQIEQRLEDVTRFSGNSVTFSFWAYSDTTMIGTLYADMVPEGTKTLPGFNCNIGMSNPYGITTDGTYFYVCNEAGTYKNTVTRYDIATGNLDNSGFTCNSGMSTPVDITSDATYLYVMNYTALTIKRYFKSSGAPAPGFTCNLSGTAGHNLCIDANGYIYAAVYGNSKIYRYHSDTGTRDTGFSCTGITYPYGIITDTSYVYVLQGSGESTLNAKIYRYNKTSGVKDSGYVCHPNPSDSSIYLTSDGTYIYVTNEVDKVRRYVKDTGADANAGFTCNTNMSKPLGMFTYSTFLYVVNSTSNKVTRYDLSNGTYDISGSSSETPVHDYEQDVTFMAGVWQPYYATFGIGNLTDDFTDPADYFAIGIIPNKSIQAGSPGGTYNFKFTQAQLEYGVFVTSFGQRTVTEEELLCQRYFQTSYKRDITPGTAGQSQQGNVNWEIGTGTVYAIKTLLGYIPFNPIMRINPSVNIYSPIHGNINGIENSSTNPSYDLGNSPVMYATDVAFTELQATAGSAAQTTINAHLGGWMQFHYTADAELN